MAKHEEMQNKTIFAVTHGQFLHNLILSFLPTDKTGLKSYNFIPLNNSLTIIDFDVREDDGRRGE